MEGEKEGKGREWRMEREGEKEGKDRRDKRGRCPIFLLK